MKKNYTKLEYDKLLNIFAEFAVTDMGKEKFFALEPMADKASIETSLEETRQASYLLQRLSSIPFLPLASADFEMKALRNGQTLSIASLLHLAQVLQLATDLKAYFFNDQIPMEEYSSLEPYFSQLYTNPGISQRLQQAIFDENTLDSKASSKLAQIRKEQTKIENDIKDTLNHFVHTSKYVMEPIVTIRNDRYVVPIKDAYRTEVKGFIHDISSSGSTVFIEPISIFEKNNQLASLKNEEMIETEKILQELTALFFPYIEELETNLAMIATIDFIFAKANLALKKGYTCPTLATTKEIYLEKAVHPLLDDSIAVPVTVSLGTEFQSLVITGPNTGGKTVLLKTIGLLTLMACSGLPIPAKENSRIYVFDQVFADIGDEQSIQESLSTFSSHMTNIIQITKESSQNSLILLDELGAGTDPVEGAQLALSILEHFQKQQSLTVVTTHYAEIKNYALTHTGFQNASFEFDLENLKPTYKLLVGIPGKSNALAICKKLGLPSSILKRAEELSTFENVQMEDLLKKIYEDKLVLEEEKEKAEQYTKEVERLKLELNKKKQDLTNEQAERLQAVKREALLILEDAKKEANQIISELEEKPDLKKANKLRGKLNTSMQKLQQKEKSSEDSENAPKDISIGSSVFVKTLNQEGIVQSLPNRSSEVTVQIGSAKMKVKLADLTLLAKKQEEKPHSQVHTNLQTTSVASEINVIGYNVDEALYVIDQYIDHCVVAKFSPIRIVHGKGTGKLRSGIHAFLKLHPSVQSYRLGTFGEGEMGVTVVELKVK